MKNEIDNPYRIESVVVSSSGRNHMYRSILVVSVLVFAAISALSMLSSNYYFGASPRTIIAALFLLPAIFGLGGKIVKLLAYFYAFDFIYSVFVYFFVVQSGSIVLNELTVYIVILKGLLGCLLVGFLLSQSNYKKPLQKTDEVEPLI